MCQLHSHQISIALMVFAFILAGCTNGLNGYQRDDGPTRWDIEDSAVSQSAEEAEARRRIRRAVDAAEQLARRREVSDADRATLRRLAASVREALAGYDDLRSRGQWPPLIIAGIGTASSAIVADDVTIIGVGDNVALVPLALAALATHILTESPASSEELAQAWHLVGYRLQI